MGGPALSDRLSGPGARERASAVFVKAAEEELTQQQQLDLDRKNGVQKSVLSRIGFREQFRLELAVET